MPSTPATAVLSLYLSAQLLFSSSGALCLLRTSAFELFSTNRSRAPVVAPGPCNGSSRHDRLSPDPNIFNCPRGHKKGPTSVEPHTATESRHVRLCGCQLHVRDDPVSPRLLCRAPDNIQSRAPRIFTISRLHSAAQALSRCGVEPRGFEPLTSAVQRRRSPS